MAEVVGAGVAVGAVGGVFVKNAADNAELPKWFVLPTIPVDKISYAGYGEGFMVLEGKALTATLKVTNYKVHDPEVQSNIKDLFRDSVDCAMDNRGPNPASFGACPEGAYEGPDGEALDTGKGWDITFRFNTVCKIEEPEEEEGITATYTLTPKQLAVDNEEVKPCELMWFLALEFDPEKNAVLLSMTDSFARYETHFIDLHTVLACRNAIFHRVKKSLTLELVDLEGPAAAEIPKPPPKPKPVKMAGSNVIPAKSANYGFAQSLLPPQRGFVSDGSALVSETESHAKVELPDVKTLKEKEAEADAEAVEPMEIPKFPWKQKIKADELFVLWSKGEDVVSLQRFKENDFVGQNAKAMDLGPYERKVMDDLTLMDVNFDGEITKEEWDDWWAVTASNLSDADFNTIMSEFIEVEAKFSAIENAIAAGKQGLDEMGFDPDFLAEIEGTGQDEAEALDEEQDAKVEEIYNVLDPEGTGAIDRKPLEGVTVDVGPHKQSVMQLLTKMDADGDEQVTLDEMKTYMGNMGASMKRMGSQDEFAIILDNMYDVSTKIAAVERAKKHLMENVPTGEPDLSFEDEGEESAGAPAAAPELPPAAELSEEQKAKLDTLFKTYDPTDQGFIDLENLKGVSVQVGPLETKVFDKLAEMDADSDGKVSTTELSSYFSIMVGVLTPEEFNVVVDDMIEAASKSAARGGSQDAGPRGKS